MKSVGKIGRVWVGKGEVGRVGHGRGSGEFPLTHSKLVTRQKGGGFSRRVRSVTDLIAAANVRGDLIEYMSGY
jgi:hypothetical protein